MRRFLTISAIFLLCNCMVVPTIDGQGRTARRDNQSATSQPSNSTSRRSPNNNDGHSNNNSSNVRPSNNNNNGNNRPSGNVAPSNGNNNKGNVRPGNGGHDGNKVNNAPVSSRKPATSRPNGGFTQAPKGDPHVGHNHKLNYGAPTRLHMPARSHWKRPVAPLTFRPYQGCPSFSTILGIALGSAVDHTLSRLLGAGYNVLSYTANAVYLSEVSMYNYMWPSATLYYTNDALHGSEFSYSTSVADRTRYNQVYNDLVRQYGAPISVNENGPYDMSSTWWGADGRYVTLSYYADYAHNGSLRYYTTLSFGN